MTLKLFDTNISVCKTEGQDSKRDSKREHEPFTIQILRNSEMKEFVALRIVYAICKLLCFLKKCS